MTGSTTKTNDVHKKRWQSLDIFRGLTIAAMILVNNPGDYTAEYQQLGHAKWHEITFSDFIFPFFLFIVGVSITLSLSGAFRKGIPHSSIYKKIIKRTIILILLGLFVNLLTYPAVGGMRIAGVLQRIAIVYLFCSVLFLQSRIKVQLAIGAFILLLYWGFLAFAPVPGLGHPSMDPIDNWVSWFDRKYLPGLLYDTDHDPEGILSTIPSIATGISGLWAGYIYKNKAGKLLPSYLLWGFMLIVTGIGWSYIFPFNKNLWTSSFVCVTSGAGMVVLAILTWIYDVKSWSWWKRPFIIFGSNAIASYILSFVFLYLVFPPFFGEGTAIINVFTEYFKSLGFSPPAASLVWAILYTGLCFIPVYIMYKKRIFLKV